MHRALSRVAAVLCTLLLGAARPQAPARRVDRQTEHADLLRIAKASLESDTIRIRRGTLVTAGTHQFASAWTRDFLSSIRGLLAADRAETVRTQLTTILDHVREDGLLPRSLDSVDTKTRVLLGTISWFLPSFMTPWTSGIFKKFAPAIGGKLKAEYEDQYGNIAIDGNALAILGAYGYAAHTSDQGWLAPRKRRLVKVFRFYDSKKDAAGLISQPAFSDWKDSLKREGPTFLTNVLYQRAGRALAADPDVPGQIDAAALDAHAATVRRAFFDEKTGLFRATLDRPAPQPTGPWAWFTKGLVRAPPAPTIDLDDNLLAIDTGFVPADSAEGKALYLSLRASDLWPKDDVPGAVTQKYPTGDKSWMVRMVGLSGYHDKLYWSWIMAKAAKVAHRMGDDAEADRILAELTRMAKRDGAIAEVYDPAQEHKPWRTWAYVSESPFLAGAAAVVETLHAVR